MIRVYYDQIQQIKIETEGEVNSVNFEGKELKSLGNNNYEIAVLDIFKVYHIDINDQCCIIEYRGIVKSETFEKQYYYPGKLGSWVEMNHTFFAVWAPVQQAISLIIDHKEYPMHKDTNGTFKLRVNQNLHGKAYCYGLKKGNETIKISDPYAKASLANRAASVVVDFKKMEAARALVKAAKQPIIMEMSVRDFSMDPQSKFSHRGQFLGLLESDEAAGFNYVKSTGVTHVQLMPVADFETVDELNPTSMYNWGYDTMQFMVLEGSYSSQVDDAHQVISDFTKVINFYHEHHIGINLDVVFNHVYDVEHHPLNLLVPYYYFRYTSDWKLSNGSFCGNEFASECMMARKLLIDSCVYFANQFKVDGFRFDLMGLIDIETMTKLHHELIQMNKHIMIYGEGWKMPSTLPAEKSATIDNHQSLSEIGFFNDVFRDGVAGKVDGSSLGILEEENKFSAIKYWLHDGYKNAGQTHQSINYIECHDNLTYADRLIRHQLPVEAMLPAMLCVIFSKGIPFIQIGQLFARDKKGDHNSYQSSDEINRISWKQLEKYQTLNQKLVTWISLRKKMETNEEYPWIEIEGDTLYLKLKEEKIYLLSEL